MTRTLKDVMRECHELGGTYCCHTISHSGVAPILSLEWRSGKTHLLPWGRFSEAVFVEGVLSVFFGDKEIAFHGLNLKGLLPRIAAGNLEKVWELPSDYEPPADSNVVFVFEIEIRRIDSWSDGPALTLNASTPCETISPRMRPKF